MPDKIISSVSFGVSIDLRVSTPSDLSFVSLCICSDLSEHDAEIELTPAEAARLIEMLQPVANKNIIS